jgi:hypothetical protein
MKQLAPKDAENICEGCLVTLLPPNVEVTGAARLYRAASVWTAGLYVI